MISDSGYFAVTRSTPLGLTSGTWYVPFTDVQDVVPGERVILRVDEGLDEQRYASRPDALGHAA